MIFGTNHVRKVRVLYTNRLGHTTTPTMGCQNSKQTDGESTVVKDDLLPQGAPAAAAPDAIVTVAATVVQPVVS